MYPKTLIPSLMFCFYTLFGGGAASDAATLHVAGFVEVNQFPLPGIANQHLGDVLFSADGNTLFVLGGSGEDFSAVYSVTVTRDASGTVISLGDTSVDPPVGTFFMDTSLEFKPGTGTLFFRTQFAVGERRPDITYATFAAGGASLFGGLALVPPPLPNAGDLLVGNWPSGVINSHSLTDNLDGTFTPVFQGFYSNSASGATGDLHFIPSRTFANDLMVTNWSSGTIEIIDIDPLTGLPVGGGTTPSVTLFASGLGAGPWGLDFDPVTGNLFIANYEGNPRDGIIQISGFPSPQIFVEIDIKPGSFPNAINLGSNGNVPVAILSTAAFDATTVDPLSVRLGGAAVKLRGKGTPMAASTDVNGDGLLDLVVHVDTTAFELTETAVDALLGGQTFDGILIRGTDTVMVVP